MSKQPNYKLLASIYTLIIIGFIGVGNYLASKSFVRADLTENRIYSISESSKKVMKNLDDRIIVEVFFSDNLPPNLNKVRNDLKDILSEFKQYGGKNLDITWKNPVTNDDDKTEASSLRIPGVEVQSFEKDKASQVKGYMGLAIKYGGKFQVIPVIQTTDNFEYDFIQNIIKISQSELPKVGILKTDTAMAISPELAKQYNMQPRQDMTLAEYQPIFNSLSENYDVKFINLMMNPTIDPAIKTLIVPGGNDSFYSNDKVLFAIDQYLMNGGNVIFLAKKVWVNLQSTQGAMTTVQNSKLFDMLKKYGVEVEPKLVLDASCAQISIPKQVGPYKMNVPVDFPYLVKVTEESINKEDPSVSGIPQIIMPWVSPLIISDSVKNGIESSVLFTSSDYSFTKEGRFNLNPDKDWQADFTQKNSIGELTKYNLAVRLKGEFESFFTPTTVPEGTTDSLISKGTAATVIVTGSSDFMSAGSGGQVNAPFIHNIVDQLTLDDNLISIRTRSLVDRTINKKSLTGESPKGTFYRVINITLMPSILIIFGILVYIRRKKIQNSVKQES